MIGITVLSAVLMATSADPKGTGPKSSSDVVEVKLVQHTLADGLECYFVELKVAEGWHVYANVEGWVDDRQRPKPHADATTVVEFLADGKKASVCKLYYPKGVVKKSAGGGEYRAYEGTESFTAWLIWDETKNASVSARVRVVATDGKTQLKESVVTGR